MTETKAPGEKLEGLLVELVKMCRQDNVARTDFTFEGTADGTNTGRWRIRLEHLPDLPEGTSRINAMSVQPDWMTNLTLQQQSVIMLAARGPDGIAKHHPCKDIVRYYRGTVLIAARYGRILRMDERADTFMSMDGFTDDLTFSERMKAYFDTIDELPHHYHMHLMHGAQILGYKHPEQLYRDRWLSFYLACCNDAHLPPETEETMDERLGDWGRRYWDE